MEAAFWVRHLSIPARWLSFESVPRSAWRKPPAAPGHERWKRTTVGVFRAQGEDGVRHTASTAIRAPSIDRRDYTMGVGTVASKPARNVAWAANAEAPAGGKAGWRRGAAVRFLTTIGGLPAIDHRRL